MDNNNPLQNNDNGFNNSYSNNLSQNINHNDVFCSYNNSEINDNNNTFPAHTRIPDYNHQQYDASNNNTTISPPQSTSYGISNSNDTISNHQQYDASTTSNGISNSNDIN